MAFCRIIIQLEFGEFVVYSVVAFFATTQNGWESSLIVNIVENVALLTYTSEKRIFRMNPIANDESFHNIRR